MPNQNGTFTGIGARMGSTDTSGGTTSPGFAVYVDNGGAPGQLLWSGSSTVANPSAVTTVTVAAGSGTYQNGWTGQLVANIKYWVAIYEFSYNSPGGGTGSMVVAHTSSGPCLTESWINSDPPGAFTGTNCNAAPVALYLTATFP
jgi:hypothetical protein